MLMRVIASRAPSGSSIRSISGPLPKPSPGPPFAAFLQKAGRMMLFVCGKTDQFNILFGNLPSLLLVYILALQPKLNIPKNISPRKQPIVLK